MAEDRLDLVRVFRIIEYIGPRHWVEDTVAKSIHGTKVLGSNRYINAATIGSYPEIFDENADGPDKLMGEKHG